MGSSKNMLIEMELERERKREALLNAPQLIEAGNELIQYLRDQLEDNSTTIAELREQIAYAESWKSKAVDHLVSGLVGAVIGTLFGLLF